MTDFDFEAPQSHVSPSATHYPWMQWVKGNKLLANEKALAKNPKAVGGFFAKVEQFPDGLPDPWIETTMSFGSKDEPGYATTTLPIALIGHRQEWFITENNREVPITKYQDGAESRVRLLCASPMVVNKANRMFPFVITFRGKGAAMGLTDRQSGVFALLKRNVLQRHLELNKKNWPDYTFWVTLEAERDASGKAVFTMVGKPGAQSPVVKVVAPMLNEPWEQHILKADYVGTPNAQQFAAWHDEAEAAGWFTQAANAPSDEHETNGDGQPSRPASPSTNGVAPASEKQVAFIYTLAKERDIDAEEYTLERYGHYPRDLAQNQASEAIAALLVMPRQTVGAGTDDLPF